MQSLSTGASVNKQNPDSFFHTNRDVIMVAGSAPAHPPSPAPDRPSAAPAVAPPPRER